jgi:hypothetical protein
MANQCTLKEVSGTATHDFQDSVVQVYECQYDTVPTNFYTALLGAQSATGTPVPNRRSLYLGTALARLYVQSITGKSVGSRDLWQWTVTFATPQDGELPLFELPQYDNPLLRPAIYNVDYMDREYVIKLAKNVQALLHGNGSGGNRPANTEGPIVNAAGKQPDEPQVDTERLEVLVIQKNYASLPEIVARNRAFKRSTNSTALIGYQPRELRYLLTQSLGVQFENGVTFWPGVTTVLAEDTDLVLDNVGTEYWDTVTDNWKKAIDGEGLPMTEPINLTLAGAQGGDNTTTITYRHLRELSYADLIN